MDKSVLRSTTSKFIRGQSEACLMSCSGAGTEKTVLTFGRF